MTRTPERGRQLHGDTEAREHRARGTPLAGPGENATVLRASVRMEVRGDPSDELHDLRGPEPSGRGTPSGRADGPDGPELHPVREHRRGPPEDPVRGGIRRDAEGPYPGVRLVRDLQGPRRAHADPGRGRSEEHTPEIQRLTIHH